MIHCSRKAGSGGSWGGGGVVSIYIYIYIYTCVYRHSWSKRKPGATKDPSARRTTEAEERGTSFYNTCIHTCVQTADKPTGLRTDGRTDKRAKPTYTYMPLTKSQAGLLGYFSASASLRVIPSTDMSSGEAADIGSQTSALGFRALLEAQQTSGQNIPTTEHLKTKRGGL